MIRTIAFLLVSMMFVSCRPGGHAPPDYASLPCDILADCNQMLTDVILGDLFTPPVASRIYAYANIAAYEALIPAYSGFVSYGGQLNGMGSMPAPAENAPCDFSVSALVAFAGVAKKLVYSQQVVADYEKKATDSLASLMDETVMKNSIDFGRRIADSVLAWAAGDNYRETRSWTRYELKNFEGAWLPTPPDYTPAIEPYWGTIRQFAMDSVQQFTAPPPMKYDMDTSSLFYKELMEVYDISRSLDTERMNTAIFWDCNPNISHHYGHLTSFSQKMTPGGHWITIACHILKHDRANMMVAAETVTKVAIGLADAFIASWYVKYAYNTIRPVTVIQKYIDPAWQAYLQTPPFPEYTSAHSTISGAATAVLARIYGEPYHWVDSSEVRYGIPVIKEFDNFIDAANEVSESRVLGGIHFRSAVLAGRDQGLQMGNFIYDKLRTRKKETAG